MPADQGNHLTAEEISALVEAGGRQIPGDATSPEASSAREHAEQCPQCSSQIAAQLQAAAALHGLEVTVNSERSDSCPDERKWYEVAAGTLAADEAAKLTVHAASCDHCGRLLREATEDLAPELSAGQAATLAKLESAESSWQHTLAAKMSARSRQKELPKADASEKKPWWRMFSFSAAPSGLRWAVVAVVLVAAAVGSLQWWRNQPSLEKANQLVAQSYIEKRPTALRTPGTGYAVAEDVRGAAIPRSQYPQSVLDAEKMIDRGLETRPGDPSWLRAKVQLLLWEGDGTGALAALQTALQASPNDAALRTEQAIALYETNKLEEAIAVLQEVLTSNPHDAVAIFNLAAINESAGNTAAAQELWQRYLSLDSSSRWADEARAHLPGNR